MFTGIFKDTSVRILITFMILLCILSSLVLPDWMQNNFMYGLSRGLAILGLMLLWRTNLVSFGHALYYGFGAYAVALCQKYFGITDILLRFAIAVIAAGLLGFCLGFILRKYREIFFAMLSLAFSMVLYGLLAKAEFLGSTDGMSISPSTLFGLELTRQYLFFLITFFVICAAVSIQAYLRSTLGHLTTAIQDNEIRVEFLGFSVQKAIHIKYVISACLAGGAGGLMAASFGQVDPDSMVNWNVSGELVFITIMSGWGNILAPFIGAIIFEFIRTYAFEWAPQAWAAIVGGTLLAIIFFFPGGIWSIIEKVFNYGKKKDVK